MTSPSARILIVLFGAIGDVTRALPLLTRLRRAHPKAYIAWAVEPLAAPLLDGHPALDERIVFERAAGILGFVGLLRMLRARHFELVLDLGRLLKTGLAAAATGAGRRIGFHRRNSREGNWLLQTEVIPPLSHYSSKLMQYQSFCEHLGLPAAPVEFGLRPANAAQARVEALLAGVPRPFVAFGLGSSCPSRRWFSERTAAVANTLWNRHRLATVLLGTAADRRFADDVDGALTGPRGNLVGRTDLGELVAVLAASALAITPDSGMMHIAAALGRPVVSVWGATSAARSAPWGSEGSCVIGRAGCAPCYLRECPLGRVCMQTVDVDAVLSRVTSLVERAEG